jgi:hypothetical protein
LPAAWFCAACVFVLSATCLADHRSFSFPPTRHRRCRSTLRRTLFRRCVVVVGFPLSLDNHNDRRVTPMRSTPWHTTAAAWDVAHPRQPHVSPACVQCLCERQRSLSVCCVVMIKSPTHPPPSPSTVPHSLCPTSPSSHRSFLRTLLPRSCTINPTTHGSSSLQR